MLGCQKYELDRPVSQAAAELPQECGCPADAFVNDDPFDELHGFIETPPVPCSRTVWPAMTLPCSTMACQAVTPAQGNVAPSSSDRGAGIFTTPSSSSTTYSASMPSMLPPSAFACTSGGASPPDQRWKKQPATLSPTFTRVTPPPTSTTSPAPSESGTILSRTGIRYAPSTMPRTRNLSEHAKTFPSPWR